MLDLPTGRTFPLVCARSKLSHPSNPNSKTTPLKAPTCPSRIHLLYELLPQVPAPGSLPGETHPDSPGQTQMLLSLQLLPHTPPLTALLGAPCNLPETNGSPGAVAESCKGERLLSFLFPPGTPVVILCARPGGPSSCSIIRMVFHNHNLMKKTRVPVHPCTKKQT